MSVTPIQKQPRFIDPNAPLAKQQEIFLELMRDPPENSRVITIIPRMAEWILDEYNPPNSNRKRKPARIIRYAEAMIHPGWSLSGEPLIFGKRKLLDGQNRLAACVRSGKSFRTHVVFGIADGVFDVINSGKSRTPGDTFFTAGVKDSGIVSPAIRWILLYNNDTPQARTSFSNQEMYAAYQDPQRIDLVKLEEAVERAKGVSKVIPKGAVAAHFYLFAHKNEKTAAKMAADFDANRHNARKLTTFLAKTRKNQQGRLHDTWMNALLVRTWLAYRENRTVTAKDLRWALGSDEYPAIV